MTVMMSGGQALLHTASPGVLGGYPNFGMSPRFSVEVEGLETPGHLGLWHSCKNLQLDLHTEKVSQGGTSLMGWWLPGKIEYSAITLERPVEEKSSKRVQAWLQDYVTKWDRYATTPYRRGRSVIIKLLDYQLNEVMRWILKDAYPAKWIGPSLGATDNTVAMETLVIEHSGFLSHATEPHQAKLSPDTGATGTPLLFHFNPEKLTLEHESELGERQNCARAELTKIMPPSLSMPDLIFDGTGTLACCEQLLKWSDPMLKGDEYYLPPLIFEWGQFTANGTGKVPVTLTKVKIDYGRFDQEGRPTRAAASLTLRRNDPGTPGQQNPTSGGLPGRSGHVMVNGETMPGIALGAYGNPARWRAVAAANQVDDPLRVRPGSVLYLPARAELARAELAGGGVA